MFRASRVTCADWIWAQLNFRTPGEATPPVAWAWRVFPQHPDISSGARCLVSPHAPKSARCGPGWVVEVEVPFPDGDEGVAAPVRSVRNLDPLGIRLLGTRRPRRVVRNRGERRHGSSKCTMVSMQVPPVQKAGCAPFPEKQLRVRGPGFSYNLTGKRERSSPLRGRRKRVFLFAILSAAKNPSRRSLL